MDLANMTAKRLHDWVIKLQWAINTKNNADEQNKPLYNKWLVEAQNEIMARRERREKYLQEVNAMNKIKTRRGVFIDIDKSDITFEHHNKVYKFSSNKKRDMFIARCKQRISFINANFNKLVNSKCYGINIDLTEMTIAQAKTKLIDCVYDTVYDTMLYR